MEYKFNHFNFNVKNLDESIKFYNEALGLKEIRRKEASDGSFTIVSWATAAALFLLSSPVSKITRRHMIWANVNFTSR